MRKKAWLALFCAAVMCMPLTACGEKDETPVDDTDGGGGEQLPALTETTDFDALVSDKLTQEQWDAAFTDEAFAGVTVKYTKNDNTRTINYGYQKNGDYFTTLKDAKDPAADFAQSEIHCFKENAVDVYIRYTGENKPQNYEKGVWYFETHEKGSEGWDKMHSERNLEWTDCFRGFVAYDFAGKFAEFSYDETQHAYTFTGEMILKYTPMEGGIMLGDTYSNYTVSDATLKFSGGRLAYAKVKSSATGQNSYSEEVYTYYNYGKTEIVIPTDAQPMPEE